MQKELQSLNNLLSKHDNNYEEFSSVSNIVFYLKDHLVLFQEEKSVKKMSFNFLVNFWAEADENGIMTWNVMREKSLYSTTLMMKI